ncbi:MAG: CYTH and CHAD domain-containing protein [Nocardioidaceae bacterium]|nr:CYTH and CHAD domain-containing protein [Nocardioidaceae bacterium]
MGARAAKQEIERSYEANPDTVLPDVAVGAATGTMGPLVHELVATYHDTPDLRLTRSRMTLRRRLGGDDDGWHLKLPGRGDTRVELHRAPGRSRRVPVSVRRLVEGVTRGGALLPVVEIATRREELRLVGDDGRVLALVADDRVTSRVLQAGAASTSSWREVEVELVEGMATLLDQVGSALEAAGLVPAAEQSKLRRALGRALGGRALGGRALDSRLPEGAGTHPLADYLARTRTALVTHDVLTRAGDDDGVHQLRVAARRLRSALRAYPRLLAERDTGRGLAAELRWLGRELADERDLQVVDKGLAHLLATEPGASAPGRTVIRDVVRRELARDGRDAQRHSREVLSSERYLALLDRLDRFVAGPLHPAVSPTQELRRGVRKAYRRLERRIAASADAGAPGSDEHGAALHEVRKAAKRLRYACEVAEPWLGKRATRLRRRAKRLQSALGRHQDTVLLQQHLEGWAAGTAGSPSVGFVLGRLHSRQDEAARSARADARRAWTRLARKKSVGWLA